MRLKAFRIQKYKTIDDTGWVDVRGDVTCMLGKNESGKSSVLQAIWKASNVAGAKYDMLYDYPKQWYTRDRKLDPVVSSLRFVLDRPEREALGDEVDTEAPEIVEVDTTYSGKREVRAELPALPLVEPVVGALLDRLDKAFETVTADSLPPLQPIVTALAAVRKVDWSVGDKARAAVKGLRAALKSAGEPLGDVRNDVFDGLAHGEEFVTSEERAKAAADWVIKNLPSFIYFEDYARLRTRIHLPTFISKKGAKPIEPDVRTQVALFEWSNLDPAELHNLGKQKQENETVDAVQRRKEERSTLLESASYGLTGDWIEWWQQRQHKLVIEADGDDLVLKVEDNQNPWKVDFHERSKGFQWFFSFYLTFLVESKKAHHGAILLLDEPGLHLHIRAQQDLLKLFQRVSAENQVVFSSHSPFMVDPDHLDNVRTVYLKEVDGRMYTNVALGTEPVGDHDTVLPLQAAVGYDLAQTLFLGKRTLIVEGITDYCILKALAAELAARGRPTLGEDVSMIFAGGTTYMMPLVSLFARPDDDTKKLVVLLDGDKIGIDKAAQLRRDLLPEKAVALMSDADLLSMKGAQVEDIIDRSEIDATFTERVPGAKTATVAAGASNVDYLRALYVANGKGELTTPEKAAFLLALVDRWRGGKHPPATATLQHAERVVEGLLGRLRVT